MSYPLNPHNTLLGRYYSHVYFLDEKATVLREYVTRTLNHNAMLSFYVIAYVLPSISIQTSLFLNTLCSDISIFKKSYYNFNSFIEL